MPRALTHSLGALTIAGVVTVGLAACTGTATGTLPSPLGSSSPVTPAAGITTVTFHGLSIAVPDSWRVEQGGICPGSLTSDYVFLPGAIADVGCAAGTPEGTFAVVTFGDFSGNTLPSTFTDQSTTRFDGMRALQADFDDQGGPSHVIDVPQLDATIEITPSHTYSLADIEQRIRLNSSDSHGCAAFDGGLASLKTFAGSGRAGERSNLVPPTPVKLTLCRYQAGWLEQGATLTGQASAKLVSILNSAPAGLSEAPTSTYDPSLCKSDSSLGSVDSDQAQDSESYLITASYSSGRDATAMVRLGYCGDLGASNGTRTAQRSEALYDALAQLVGSEQAGPTDVVSSK